MRRKPILLALAGLIILFALLLPAPASATSAPYYDIRATWGDTYLPPGGEGQLQLQVRNVGEGTSEEALSITDQLPAGVTATQVHWDSGGVVGGDGKEHNFTSDCTGNGTGALNIEGATTITCVLPAAEVPTFAFDYLGEVFIDVAVGPEPLPNPGTNLATVSGGGSPVTAKDEDQVTFSPTPSPFGIVPGSFAADVFGAAYPFGAPSRQAGDHPFEQRVDFEFDQESQVGPDGTRFVDSNALVRTVAVTLPRGLIGNPQALPKCSQLLFNVSGFGRPSCPSDTQVGYINVPIGPAAVNYGRGGFPNPNDAVLHVPIYNLEPPKGSAIDLGFAVEGLIQAHIFAHLDPARDYAIEAISPNITGFLLIRTRSVEVTLWGVPGDPAHDRFRYFPHKSEGETGAPFGDKTIRPFFTNPMDCEASNGGHRIEVESYQQPGFTPPQEYPDPLEVTGCRDPRFRFNPEVELTPTDRHAGAPTGLDVHLKDPLRSEEVENVEKLYAKNGYVQGIATPPIKKVLVTFPAGMTLSPSAAQGLTGCSLAQIGIERREGRYVPNDKPVACPDSSQYGTLVLHTPLLPTDEQPHGFIYIAKQGENPNREGNKFLALYLVIEEPETDTLVKIPGEVSLDKETGQIAVSFDDLPQLPVSDFQMTIKSGVRAGLVEPSTCGRKAIDAEFFTWQNPTRAVAKESSYEVTEKPDGSPCANSLAERPFAPSLSAGTLNPRAGAYSPFVMHLTRTDDDQEFSQLGVTLPMGLAAKFAGVGICPDSGIAQALSRETTEGAGAAEQADPSCPASSEIGTTMVGAGVGVPLAWVPGKVYLAGPYRGAPISLVVISPALVGPYDLGVITVRTALYVNPETAQGEALSDPFPQIFQGIPVRIRDIRLSLNRPGFTLNPTSCEPKRIEARITGTGGIAANPRSRFQASDCASLGFHPSLAFHLYGKTTRGAHPRLKAVVKMPQGGANIARAAVALPPSEFLDQGHLNNVCTRVQFKAHECPAASIYGWARAKTPLFDQPLEGPVYLRASSHHLPDLVAALKGPASQPVEVDLDGRIDSAPSGGIRNTFELVPDAPVSEFTLTMRGGSKGLLENAPPYPDKSLCESRNYATAKFTAQNGRALTLHPAMQASCPKGRKGGKRRHGGHRR